MVLVLVMMMSDGSNSWDGACVVIVIKVVLVVVVLLPTSSVSGFSFTLLYFIATCTAMLVVRASSKVSIKRFLKEI